MALNKQNVPVIFDKGIDRTDPYILSPGKLTILQNMVFEDAQTISLRRGMYELLLTPAVASIPSPYTRTNPSFSGTPYRMAQNQGALLLESSAGLFSRAAFQYGGNDVTGADKPSMLQARTATATAAPGRPDFARATVETEYVGSVIQEQGLINVFGTAASEESVDMGRIENYDGNGHTMSLWAWIDSASGGFQNLHIRAFDEGESGTTSPRAARTQVFEQVLPLATSTYNNVRVLASSTDFYVLIHHISSGNVTIPLRLTAASGAVAFPTFSATTTSNVFDAVIETSNDRIVIAYQDAAAPTLRIAQLNAAASAESFGSSIAITADTQQLSLLRAVYSGAAYYYAFYTCTGTETVIRCGTLSAAGVPDVQRTIYTAATAVGRITAVDYDATAASFTLFYDLHASTGVYQLSVDKVSVVGTNTGGTAGIAQNAYLYARPLVYGTKIQVPVCFLTDTVGATIFVVQAQTVSTDYYPATVQKTVCTARIHYGAAGNITACWAKKWRLPSVFKETITGDMLMPAARWGAQALAEGGFVTAETQVWQARINFTSQDLGYAEVNRNTVLAGSCPQSFDGSFFEETGFNHRPYITNVVSAGVGSLQIGTYLFCATFVREDAHGNIIESAPSDVYTEVVAGANVGYTVTVNNYGLTSCQNVKTRIYRTTVNGSTFYLDSGIANVFSAGDTDTEITANTPIYTTGDVYPNEPMPPCRVVVEHDDRLWCAGGEAGDTIYFSKGISDDIAPEWNRLFNRRIPVSAGRVVNMVSLDDKLVIFCEKRIGFIYGDGPTDTGAQDNYSEFIEAVSGYAIPWGEPHSVVRATDGVWFRCGFGFRLLGRNMQIVQEGGSDLASEIDEAMSSLTVVRALIGSTAQQVRFYVSDGTVYVYDMSYKQWSQFTNFSAVDCTSIGDDFYHLSSTPKLYVQNKNSYHDRTDDSGLIVGTLTTAWLSFAGLQGFQRVSRIMLLGQLPIADSSGYTVVVQAAYDFVDATYTTLYSGSVLRLAAGSTAIQMEMQPTTQKCESLRLKVTVTPIEVATDGTRTIRLTGINLVVGLKQGRYKLPSANKV